MKRFLVFIYAQYYPDGGWNDFYASFDTREEAEAEAGTATQFGHVVDSYSGKIIYQIAFGEKFDGDDKPL